jgi:hypothetical protein
MKRLIAVPFLLLAIAVGAIAGDPPRVGRTVLSAMEKSLDDRVTRLWDDNPFVLLGPTRGIYLDGYGVVFTAEVNLATGPTMLMHPQLTKEEIERHRQKKLERLPQLMRAMRQALLASAASMDNVPAEEQIVIVTFLSRYPWEDATGLPVQITMQAQRKKLIEAQRAGGAAALEAAIHVVEN